MSRYVPPLPVAVAPPTVDDALIVEADALNGSFAPKPIVSHVADASVNAPVYTPAPVPSPPVPNNPGTPP